MTWLFPWEAANTFEEQHERKALRHIASQNDQILNLLNHVRTAEREIMANLDPIKQAVSRLTAVDESAIALLNQLSDLIRGTSDEPAVQALADQVDAEAANLANAVVANTPPPAPVAPPEINPPPDVPSAEPPVDVPPVEPPADVPPAG